MLYIKYEDLKSRTPGVNVATMKRVTDFLKVPASTEKLACAFVLAENRDAHRNIDAQLSMTKEDAYTQELTCRMWTLFGAFAAKHGYRPYNGFNCTIRADASGGTYPKIHRVNVGAQGEYDKKWVKPGGKLIDFGGYNRSAYTGGGAAQPAGGGGRRIKPRPGGGDQGVPSQKQLQKRAAKKSKQAQAAAMAGSIDHAEAPSGGSDLGIGAVGLHQPAWKL